CGGRIQITSGKGWMILLYLAFVSAAAYSVWALLLRRNPVSRVTVYGFLNPMFGVIISGIVLHEEAAFTLIGFLSLLLVCVGIAIVNTTRQGQKES
ncbi:MAG: EamA family transporter, partial [Oscillospiraceae bacterium]|nr:EamA family transporter [Oscillospiraceae bacterium]